MATCPNVESTVYKTSRGKSSAGLQAVDETPAVIELLDERYFVRMLRLERKRCERSHEPFALLLLETNAISEEDSAEGIVEIARAVSACTRETDVFGWYKQSRVLGLIISQIGTPACANSSLVSARIAHSLQERLSAELFAQLKMKMRIFPDESEDEVDGGDDHTFY